MNSGRLERQKKVYPTLRVGCGVFFGVCRLGIVGKLLKRTWNFTNGISKITTTHILRTIESAVYEVGRPQNRYAAKFMSQRAPCKITSKKHDKNITTKSSKNLTFVLLLKRLEEGLKYTTSDMYPVSGL